jgi:hypothetical protein
MGKESFDLETLPAPATASPQEQWRPRWYYGFENRTTGKKYTGQTVRLNMDSYCGSGGYWEAHNNKHGGHNRENLKVLFQHWITSKDAAQAFLDEFERQNPDYYLSSNTEWANQVRETTSDSTGAGMKGLTKDPEVVARMAEKLAGRKKDPEVVARMSASLTGRTKETHEGVARMAAKHQKKIYCAELDATFPSRNHVAQFLRLLDDSYKNEGSAGMAISYYLTGKRKTPVSGYTFAYA